MPDLIEAKERMQARKALNLREHRIEYLGFTVCGDTYGVPLGEVREILKLPPVTEVPRAPDEFMGVVSVRGLLVTVMDLRRRLRGARVELSKKGRILLVEGAEKEMIGLYVDEVLQVYRLVEADIEAAASVLGGQTAEYVVGIGRSETTMLTLIDLTPILGRPATGDKGDAA